MRQIGWIAAACLLLAGCRFPVDTEGTLDRVQGGTLRVGVVDAPPFVEIPEDGDPRGVEIDLVERFAEQQGAEVEWFPGGETELMGALHGRRLDIVIGGFTRHSPWSSEITLTRPYLHTKTVIAAPDERLAAELNADLEGHTIAVEEATEAAAKLTEDTDAVVEPVSSLDGVTGPVAVADYLLDDLGYVATDAELVEHEHAFAVAPGENAFLVELERFLLSSEELAEELLAGARP